MYVMLMDQVLMITVRHVMGSSFNDNCTSCYGIKF